METWLVSPRFVSFATRFLVIGQFWLAHHRMFGLVRPLRPDLLWLNLVALLTVTFLPFPTALLGALTSRSTVRSLRNITVATAWLVVAATTRGSTSTLLRGRRSWLGSAPLWSAGLRGQPSGHRLR
jgi:uncharacterized membrane protein